MPFDVKSLGTEQDKCDNLKKHCHTMFDLTVIIPLFYNFGPHFKKIHRQKD